MKRNLLSVLLILVATGLAMKWYEQPAKERPAIVTETVPAGYGENSRIQEPRISFDGPLDSMGYLVDGIELGMERSKVEQGTGPTTSWTTFNFPNGIQGQFPRYYEGDDSLRIAYDLNDRVYCLRGNELTLPNEEVLRRYSRVSRIKAVFGETPITEPYEKGIYIHYPELGLTFDFYDRTVGREKEMRSVFLSPPWDPTPVNPRR